MSTGIYLEDHPPARRQYRARFGQITGCITMHTAESILDTVGPDTGAEAVADFIRRRADPGSYHRLCDSDSVVPLVRFTLAAYGDGTGSNEFGIHISFACRTTDWVRMSAEQRAGFLRQGAKAAAEAIRFCATLGITVPLERITKAESDAGRPGFITHGERDPGRRTDPGQDFPWSEFFNYLAEELGIGKEWTEMATEKEVRQAVQAATRKVIEEEVPQIVADALDEALYGRKQSNDRNVAGNIKDAAQGRGVNSRLERIETMLEQLVGDQGEGAEA